MYEPTKFEAVLWHPKDGVRKVSVYLGPGAMPFSSDPSQVGVQFLMCDPDQADKPLAMLFVERGEARGKVGETQAMLKYPDVAKQLGIQINKVLAQVD